MYVYLSLNSFLFNFSLSSQVIKSAKQRKTLFDQVCKELAAERNRERQEKLHVRKITSYK
jgi:hypothetical protein